MWQSDRGLQVESVAATPLVYARAFLDGEWSVGMSQYNAYEITGPGVDTALQVADLSFLLGLAVIGVLGWRAVRLDRRTPATVALVMLATTMVMIVTSKTLSPQYVLWLGGPVCALLVSSDEPEHQALRWPLLVAAGAWLLALATQVVYPLRYADIVGSPPGAGGTSVLVLRNLALVAAAVAVVALAWRSSRQEPVFGSETESPDDPVVTDPVR